MTIHQHASAGIDLGSNTFRLLVAECSAGRLVTLAKKMATVRLGRGLEDNGRLHEESMQKGFAVLRSFREILDHCQPQTIRICGTQALRQAQNSRFFLQKAEEILRHSIDVIDGQEEARLSLAGALSGCKKILSGPLLLIDAGGGSTELVFAESSAGEARTTSVPLGVVRLTERFIAAAQPDLSRLDRHIAETLDPAFTKLRLPGKKQPMLIIGCGGTATSMAALNLDLIIYNESLVHGHVLPKTAVKRLWEKMIALPAAKRNGVPCLGEGRGEILPAGIRIYLMILKLLQQDQMQVSDTGLLEGILLSRLQANSA